jgi:hypothetical protein
MTFAAGGYKNRFIYIEINHNGQASGKGCGKIPSSKEGVWLREDNFSYLKLFSKL